MSFLRIMHCRTCKHLYHKHQYRNHSCRITAAVLLGLISLGLTPRAAQAQSLEQAVAETLASNPEIKRAYNTFMSRNEATRSSVGDYLQCGCLGRGRL